MSSMPSPQRPRSADRFGLVLPITMEGEEGTIHDMSSTGLLVESSSAPAMGSQVSLSLRYQAGGREHQLDCIGQVVRVEQHGDGFNIAVQLSEPLFDESDGQDGGTATF